jgi:hypothetical protein
MEAEERALETSCTFLTSKENSVQRKFCRANYVNPPILLPKIQYRGYNIHLESVPGTYHPPVLFASLHLLLSFPSAHYPKCVPELHQFIMIPPPGHLFNYSVGLLTDR